MITAVDTSVLLDVFTADNVFAAASGAALRTALRDGRLIACDIVWAETAAHFEDEQRLCATMSRLGVSFSPLAERAACEAGQSWRKYRAAGGSRQRLVADFLIAAHAKIAADRLLTRDRGFYRDYFQELTIMQPEL